MAVSTGHLKGKAAHAESTWPWHDLVWSGVPVSELGVGQRRMEAENHLAPGRLLRRSFAAVGGWHLLSELAEVWQPSRLKGITLDSRRGTPFLTATQVFDVRPMPRKWLSVDRTSKVGSRYLPHGTIVVTCSGSVGRATLTFQTHDKILISHDLLRLSFKNQSRWGWVYAYLRSQQAREMMRGEQYGHMIKHLGPDHLHNLPIPRISDKLAQHYQARVQEILYHREQGHELTLASERRFEEAVGPVGDVDFGETGFDIGIQTLTRKGRRLEAAHYTPLVTSTTSQLAKTAKRMITVSGAGFEVWVPGRYRRIPASNGVVYLDSSEILEINPDEDKRVADCRFGDSHNGRVEAGWVLIPCSGQVYGIIGTAVIAGENLVGKAVSNHVMRIAPTADCTMRTGYLQTALGHPTLGRTRVKALAFGSSVPEISPHDLGRLMVPRLEAAIEDEIADLAEEAVYHRGQADLLERKIAVDAGMEVAKLLSGPALKLVEDADDREVADQRLKEIKDAPQTVVRGDALAEMMNQWES